MTGSYSNPTDDCVQIRSDSTDYVWPAQVMDHDGHRYLVTHADELMLGSMTTDAGARVAALIMLESGTGRGHAQPQTAHEMRELAGRLVKLADRFEAEADAAAREVIDAARKPSR